MRRTFPKSCRKRLHDICHNRGTDRSLAQESLKRISCADKGIAWDGAGEGGRGFIKIYKSSSHEGGTYLCKDMSFDCENNSHTIMLCLLYDEYQSLHRMIAGMMDVFLTIISS